MSRPRIRTLKPELWQDEKIGKLSRDARLLFVGLVTMADDEGRLRALPALILGHVFPYDPDALRKVDAWLEEVGASGLVFRYEANGTPYIQIGGWSKHQVMNKTTPSDLPAPPDEGSRNGQVTEPFKKAAIPERVRREVAKAAGAVPGETVTIQCHYCGAKGTASWPRIHNGKPGSWVSFKGLELDHVHPEYLGGRATVDNIVLACRSCNRRKGHKVTESVPLPVTESVTTGSRSGHGVPSRAPEDRIGSDQEEPPLTPPQAGGRASPTGASSVGAARAKAGSRRRRDLVALAAVKTAEMRLPTDLEAAAWQATRQVLRSHEDKQGYRLWDDWLSQIELAGFDGESGEPVLHGSTPRYQGMAATCLAKVAGRMSESRTIEPEGEVA